MASQIPGYQVIRKIGDGGMSSVYLAIQLSVGREIALKILSPELRTDPTFAERFYREANIVGALSHPNVISIYDVGKHGKHYYMAMDYLPGASCKDLINDQQITALKALKIIKDITKALEYVHAQGYLHCDIKPDNILLRADGSAVLTDFGIAREIKDEKPSNSIAGTPHYMSPEQAQGHKLDKTSDIYNLGVLLFEMLSYRLPYMGKDAISIAIKHVSAPIPALPDQYEALAPLVNKMLAKKPGQRFQNANELIHAIDFYESQYLKLENTELPLKLKINFTLQKTKENIKSWLGLHKRLQYSFKHGLILSLTEDNFSVSDIEAIAKTIEKTLDTRGTATSSITGLTTDSLALALETEQARKIIPAWLLNIFIFILLTTIIMFLSNNAFNNYMEQLGKPEIIYID